MMSIDLEQQLQKRQYNVLQEKLSDQVSNQHRLMSKNDNSRSYAIHFFRSLSAGKNQTATERDPEAYQQDAKASTRFTRGT
jgi:hypothetical protein